MKFIAKNTDFSKQQNAKLQDALSIVYVYQDSHCHTNHPALNKLCTNIIALGDFTGDAGQSLLLSSPHDLHSQRLLLVGLGGNISDTKQTYACTEAAFIKATQSIASHLKNTQAASACIYLNDITVDTRDQLWQAQKLTETIAHSNYRFEQMKSGKTKSHRLKKVTLISRKDIHMISEGLKVGTAVADGMRLCRDLGNLPGNVCTPSYLARTAKQLARGEKKLQCKILEEKDMKALGMGSLLSVSAGSDEPAKLIQLEYKGGKKTQPPIVLVGKGVTFDTGGISLKPGAGMDEMKFDMCGAASVLGTMQTLLSLELPINVIALVAASENMPNGSATKPGDIVTSMAGTTIEILNTDAEGRLVLCDALTYAERFNPRAVIDIATLTGACVIALGKHASGLYSNNNDLAEALLRAGTHTGDRAWQMPLWDDYQMQLKSNFADLANIGGREAGSVTAACFLSNFTKKYHWAHLDIAGTAWLSGAQKGATGRPVPLLTQYLINAVQ